MLRFSSSPVDVFAANIWDSYTTSRCKIFI
uniref:Uncharacterized protein n=1 Tax=Arundo donax TaxID=35708 RepID=A0A0A8YRP4_ARUDO